MEDELVKACTQCGKEKALNLFPIRRNRKSGYFSACKECLNKRQRQYGKSHPEKMAAKRKRKWQ